MTIPRTIEVPGDDEYPVRGDLYLPESRTPRGVVVLCHGLKGHKAWGFLPFLAGRLCAGGIAALSIDMSLNGTFNGTFPGSANSDTRYVRPDLFERNTLRREYLDVQRVVRFVADGGLRSEIGANARLGLFGHSRGGVACVLNALELPEVTALATWSTTADPDFYTKKQKERWRREGRYAFTDVEGTSLAIGIDYLNDLEAHRAFYQLVDRVPELETPHLIVHGAADVVIDVESASLLHNAEVRLERKRLVVIRTGHTFGLPYPAPEPLVQPPAPLTLAVDETVAWFEQHLQGGNG